MPAGAVAGRGDERSIHAKLFCVLVNNRGTSFCIIVRRRKKGTPGPDDTARRSPGTRTEPGKLAQLIVMGGKAAADKTAAVVVDKRG